MSTIDMPSDMNPRDLRALAEQSNAWPFEQAKAIVARQKKTRKDEVLFETGYGPSGLPHIGTFGEVARTTMVRHAFRVLTEDKIKTRLLAFSDDMDGLRKVPDNVPNKEMLAQHLGQPLTRVPDPFGTHDSFGAHNNARLRAFLDTFGFDYEFASSTDYYTSGRFDGALLQVLRRFDQVMAIMLPSLREERAATYSPFLPICPRTGVVLQVPIVAHDVGAGTVSYDDPETYERVTLPVTGGHCKLQWKPDWAMRWFALGVDYEMAGKDLIDSVKLSGKICAALGGTQPEGFNYELFLDDKGQKISKSKGNGLTIDEWLRYASPESLSLFMYREPKAAKRLHFDVIPRNVDDYQQFLEGFPRQDGRQQLGNPVWHIHSGHPPKADMPVTFQLLPPRCDAADASEARCDGRLCHQLLSRLRRADQKVPRADRGGTGRAAGSARCAVEPAGGFLGRRDPERGLRDRPARAVPRPGQEGQGRPPGRDARLVQHALPGAARPGEGPALRLLRRGLWPWKRGQYDRRRAGKVGVIPLPSLQTAIGDPLQFQRSPSRIAL
jgi:lysyl-tRNA synthetase class 1